jgi:hypothetical protein
VAYPSTQDLLIFVGIPLATIGIVFALVYASPGGRGTKRYRPGRPYPYAPVWFLARPEKDGPAGRPPAHSSGHAQLEGSSRAALTASDEVPTATDASAASVDTVSSGAPAPQHPGVTGGASDRW